MPGDQRLGTLWAPWRMTYIGASPARGCIFCEARAARRDADRYVLQRSTRAFALLNLYPYNSGHLMVAPYQHGGTFEDLPRATVADLMALTQRALRALRATVRPDGFNLGVNEGQVAGAGVVDHVHLHVVPRWNGDTNFMPVLAASKVMPQHLRKTYRQLRRAF